MVCQVAILYGLGVFTMAHSGARVLRYKGLHSIVFLKLTAWISDSDHIRKGLNYDRGVLAEWPFYI